MKKKKCYLCNGELIDDKKVYKGISYNVERCQKCEESFSTIDETERIRKILHPTFFQRIKNSEGKKENEKEKPPALLIMSDIIFMSLFNIIGIYLIFNVDITIGSIWLIIGIHFYSELIK